MNAKLLIPLICFLAACVTSVAGQGQPAANLTGRWSASDGGSFVQRCADNPTFVTSLYQSILKRAPDSGGHQYWVNSLQNGMRREDAINGFFESAEYRGFGRNNRDYARDLYNGVLGREPEAEGHNYWIRAMDGGMSRAEVLRRFFASPEYQGIVTRCGTTGTSTAATSPGGSFVQRCADNPTFVTSLYQSILKRAPDSGGHQYWVNSLQNGMRREDAINGFFESAEYRGFGRNNRDYARDLYNGVLGREPEAEGHNYWIRAMDGGMSRAEVLRRFFASPEYQGIVTRCGATR